jgi:uncharacterized repeat protein (TIGR03803 family)
MNKVKTFNFSRVALSIGAVALLAACGGSQPPIGAPGAMPQASAHAASINSANYKVVYSFEAPPDGNGPLAGVIGRDDTFYGTTFGGGTECRRRGGCGTVFSLTTGGAEMERTPTRA